jgi:hypothetical protein
MTPSFSIWSFMASKEALVVFLVAVVARYVVDIYYNRERFWLFHVPVLVLLYMFKPQFFSAIIFIIGTSKISKHMRAPATFAWIAGVASLGILFLMHDLLDVFSRKILLSIISEFGQSQRAGLFLAERYDFFFRAPEGIILAFMGPTVFEATTGLLQMISFVESALIVGTLVIFFIVRLARVPVYGAMVAFFTVFWTMLANYPVGLANPGTAVRYRTDYILIIILAVAVITSRELYVKWRSNSQSPSSGEAT